MRGILAALHSAALGVSPAPLPAAVPRPAPVVSAARAPAPSLVSAPLLSPAPALPALRAASAPLRLPADAPAESARESAAAPFGESFGVSAPADPVAAPASLRPRYRLAPQGFEHAAPSLPDAPPRPRAPEPRPFLLRHYRLVRFLVAPLLRLVYAVRADGLARLPAGPALIVPNHVSFMDPLLVSLAANRPMRFVMYRGIYETPGFEWIFRSLGAIPISPKDPKEVIEESLYRARRALAAGETVVVFPEGQLTRDGEFSPFRRGFERVAAGTDAPVIPAYIGGMWGSAFSRRPGASFGRGVLARLRGRRRVAVRFGPALTRADYALARDAVARLAASPGP
jgi:1-acyl-sn-glycerol-3-phosphate acyltransferase